MPMFLVCIILLSVSSVTMETVCRHPLPNPLTSNCSRKNYPLTGRNLERDQWNMWERAERREEQTKHADEHKYLFDRYEGCVVFCRLSDQRVGTSAQSLVSLE